MTLQAQTLQANEESQPIKAANWSEPSDGFTSMFYEKYRSQIWFSEEIALVQDMRMSCTRAISSENQIWERYFS